MGNLPGENVLLISVTKTERKDGKKEIRYCHKVLETKLVLSDKIAISLGSGSFVNHVEKTVDKEEAANAYESYLYTTIKD